MKRKRSKARAQLDGLVISGMMAAAMAAMVTGEALYPIMIVAIFMPIVGYLATRLPETEHQDR